MPGTVVAKEQEEDPCSPEQLTSLRLLLPRLADQETVEDMEILLEAIQYIQVCRGRMGSF